MNNTTWITTISTDVAIMTLRLLDEIVEQMDMLRDPVVISLYVRNMGIGQEDNVRRMKMGTLEMLKKRGVVRDAEFSPTGGPRGGEGIWIDADEEIVRTTHGLLRDRVRGPKPVPAPARAVAAGPGRVFLVCGRDKAARLAVARFLERLGITPVILEEQTNQGRTIIEKLEHHTESDYAVVLLTPDDEGRLRKDGEPTKPRPRQNVVGELFYCTAKLGRGRVCALKKGEMELPSDYDGFLYVTMDDHDGWQAKLAREMRDARVKADYSKIL